MVPASYVESSLSAGELGCWGLVAAGRAAGDLAEVVLMMIRLEEALVALVIAGGAVEGSGAFSPK